ARLQSYSRRCFYRKPSGSQAISTQSPGLQLYPNLNSAYLLYACFLNCCITLTFKKASMFSTAINFKLNVIKLAIRMLYMFFGKSDFQNHMRNTVCVN